MPSIPAELLRTDRDRRFDDWGETVTFRRFAAVVDPQSGQPAETAIDIELAAIVSGPQIAAVSPGATRAVHENLDVLLKAEDIPAGQLNTSGRIVRGGMEYDILGFEDIADGHVVSLTCRRQP
jgi:hypothetical protein